MPKNKRPKKSHHFNNAKRAVRGLRFQWHHVDPLADTEHGNRFKLDRVDHRSPYLRSNTEALLHKHQKFIFHTDFVWRIDIDAVCKNGDEVYEKGVVMQARCRFGQLNEHLHENTEAVFKTLNMKHYKYMRYTAEVVGK